MNVRRRQFLHLSVLAVAIVFLTLPGHCAWSQTARTIKIVVPYTPGGPADTLARLIAEQVGRTHGPAMVIENRPGADTVIGTEAVTRTPPNGSTLLIVSTPFVINPQMRKVNYDPLTSFEPICHLVSFQSVIIVNSASPYHTLAELFNAAARSPAT